MKSKKIKLIIAFAFVCMSGMSLYVSCTPKTAEASSAPKTAEDFFKRGDTYFQKGNYDLAIADYTEAIRLDSDYN